MVTIHSKQLRSLLITFLMFFTYQNTHAMTIAWEQISGYGDCIAAGPSGQVLHVNAEAQSIWWGNGITATNYKPTGWSQLNGGLVKASIGLNGIIWGVNAAGNIFYTTNQGANWTNVGGTLADVSVGSNGNVWGVQSSGNIFIYQTGYGWAQIDGALKQISVGKNDMVVGVNATGQAYIRVGTPGAGSSWTQINPGNSPEAFSHVSAGHDGCVWAIGTSGKLYFWKNNTTWVNVNIPTSLKVVNGSHNGQVWAMGTNRAIYYGRIQPGGAAFTYPGDAASFAAYFADTWKLPATGKGIIKFTAKGTNNLVVTLTPSKASSGDIYYFGLGYSNCSVGYIRRILTGDGAYNKTSANIAGTAAQLNSAEDRPYWIKIDGGTMSMGTGTVVGTNQFMTYTDRTPLAVQYIGFGGLGTGVMEYKNITIEAPAPLVMPNVQVWCVGKDNSPYLWINSMWIKFDGGLTELALTPAGEGWCVGTDGQVWSGTTANLTTASWNWKQVPLAVGAKHITVGGNGQVWCLGKDNRPYLWTGSVWQLYNGGMQDLAVASDGTIWCVDMNNQAEYHAAPVAGEDPLTWAWVVAPTNPVGITRISAAPNNQMWAIGKDTVPYLLSGSTWKKTDGGVSVLTVGPSGEGWCVGTDGQVWSGGAASLTTPSWSWKQIPISVGALSIAIPPVKSETKIPTTVYDPATPPGGATFKVTGLASNTIDQNTTFHANWKLPAAGSGVLQFKIVAAAQDAWIVFGPTQKYEVGKSIALGIGGYFNAQTYFRTDIYGDNKFIVADKITAGDTYWISLISGTIACGKGTIPGQNKLLEWTDPLVNSQLYIGFGGYQAVPVELSNISITTYAALLATQFQTAVSAIPDPATNFTTALTQINAVLANQTFYDQATLVPASLVTKIQALVASRVGKSATDLNSLKTLLATATDAKITYLSTAKATLTPLLTDVTGDYNAQVFVDQLANTKIAAAVRDLLGKTSNVTLPYLKGKKAIVTR